MKKRIFCILQLSPPKHGASFVGDQIKRSSAINEQFDLEYIRLSTKPKSTSIFSVFIQLYNYCLLLTKVLKKVTTAKYDLVYITPCASGMQFYKDFVICLMAKLFQKNVVYHFHNKGIYSNQFLTPSIKKVFFNRVNVILLSKLLKYDLEDYVNDDRIFYCPNGVNFDITGEKNKKFLKNKNVLNILFLSNMIRTKGVFVLLEACTILKERNSNFTCNFVGPWYEDLEEEFFNIVRRDRLQDNVKYLGPKYGKDKYDVFENSDIFVFPTYYPDETFGLVNIEAMSFGLPVVSTDEGGIPDIIRDEVDGYIVPKENPVELAKRLEILMNDNSLRQKMSESAKLRYVQNYTEEHFETRFIEVIKQILEG